MVARAKKLLKEEAADCHDAGPIAEPVEDRKKKGGGSTSRTPNREPRCLNREPSTQRKKQQAYQTRQAMDVEEDGSSQTPRSLLKTADQPEKKEKKTERRRASKSGRRCVGREDVGSGGEDVESCGDVEDEEAVQKRDAKLQQLAIRKAELDAREHIALEDRELQALKAEADAAVAFIKANAEAERRPSKEKEGFAALARAMPEFEDGDDLYGWVVL